MQTDRGALALLIVLDQFSRNLFRGSSRSFAQDAKALDIARQLVDAGKDREFGEFEKLFLYMPFEHSEDLADQERCRTCRQPGGQILSRICNCPPGCDCEFWPFPAPGNGVLGVK